MAEHPLKKRRTGKPMRSNASAKRKADTKADGVFVRAKRRSFALSDENFHAPNEFFRLSSIADGLAAWVEIIRQIAEIDPAAFTSYRRT